MSRMGLREYARHRKALGLVGGGLSAVQKAIATGRIKLIQEKPPLVDSEAADADWAANSDPAKRRQEGPVAPPPAPLVDPPLLSGEVLAAPGTLTRRSQFWGPDWPEPQPLPPVGERLAALPSGDNVVGGDDFQAWRTRLARAQALREERKDLEESGQLIRADEARRAFTAIGRMFGQARENVAAQLAPQIVGLTDVREIERRIRKFLRDSDQRVADEIRSQHADIVEGGGADDRRCSAG